MATVSIEQTQIPGLVGKNLIALKITGQLDESNVDEEAKKVYAIIEKSIEAPTLIFDFAELTYMNSKAIGYLTDWYSKITDKGGKALIVRPRENILDLLQVVGLSQLVPCYRTVDEAKLALQK